MEAFNFTKFANQFDPHSKSWFFHAGDHDGSSVLGKL